VSAANSGFGDPYAPQQGQQHQGQQMTAGAANAGVGAPPPAADAQNGQSNPKNQQVAGGLDQPVAKPTPVYKKWWFWAVVAVSAYVVYEIASNDSSPSSSARVMLPAGPAPQANQSGMTLMRW
jgi:hypothetical protein